MDRYVAALNTEHDPLSTRRGWAMLAKEEGVELRFPSSFDKPAQHDFIANAAALWVNHPSFLVDEFWISVLHEEIGKGKRCFIEIGASSIHGLEQYNALLAPYGMQGTMLALHDRAPMGAYRPREIVISRTTHPGAFHNAVLFDGVTDVVIDTAQVLRMTQGGTPILTAPLNRVDVVDRSTDFLKPLDATAVSLIGSGGDNGTVIATSGRLCHDAPAGAEVDLGIDANPILARNILRWLAGQPVDQSLAAVVEAFRLIDHIEHALLNYLRRALSTVHADWWTDGVPENVRITCATRAEQERNQLQKHCYLDLINLKEIAASNWQHVEADWRRVGWGGNKKAGLAWFDPLNDVRKVVMHPAKRAFGASVSKEDLSFLRELQRSVDALLSGAPVLGTQFNS